MKISLKEYRARLLDTMLTFLWRHWSNMGVAGHTETRVSWIIDPEALLAFSATLGRWDARLFDEILDWLTVNGRFINIQRLRRMLDQYDYSGGPVISAMARLLRNRTATQKWRRLAEAHHADPATPLFYSRDGIPLPLLGEPDETFASCCLLRNPLGLRGLSRRFPPESPGNLVLKLRALFGIQARCEIIACLLDGQALHPPEVARRTGYFHKTIQDAMVEMAHSGVLRIQKSGKIKRYWLEPESWRPLLAPNGASPLWICWPPLFSALEKIWLKTGDIEDLEEDPLLLSSELRRLMQDVRPDIETAGFHGVLSDEKRYQGEEYTNVFFKDIEGLSKGLNRD